MYLESTIVVNRPLAEVWAFFENPSNLAKWDRGVERVVVTTSAPVGVGFTFDTFGPATKNKEGFRSSYLMSEYEPSKSAWIDLTNSKWFSQARWLTAVEPTEGGTTVRMGIALTIRWQHIYLWPILRLNSRALLNDLGYLKQTIESA